MSFNLTDWIDARIKVAVDEAVKQLHDEITSDIGQMETNLVAQITSLPGLIASQIGHVVVDSAQIAQEVVGNLSEVFEQLPQQIIAGLLDNLPFPFKKSL